jgi:aminoglycoside phosphotransferase (APT) family kinase protein
MRPISLPEIPYGATAVRPEWSDLPTGVRAAISVRIGAPITAVTSAGGGFTRAFAAVIEAGGERVFVKAAADDDPTANWYAREAAITAALPHAVPAARPRWTLAASGYFVLCLDAVDGEVPALPWSPDALDAALRAWSAAAAALADPSAALAGLGLPPLPDLLRAELSCWSPIAAGQAPMPSTAPAWARSRVPELAVLERGAPALVAGPGMLHGDLRVDNVLIDRAGAAWLCDWTWPCLGAPWFDTVTLLVSAYASGLDADALLGPWNAPPAGVDGALAALSGYWLVRASGGPSSASPHSRQHQRFSGEQALAWLADRRGWATDEEPPGGRFGGQGTDW